MKRIFILSLLALGFFAQPLLAQKTFSGIVTYKISYEGGELTPEQQAQSPNQQILTIATGKINKIKSEIKTPMGGFSFITDYDANTISVMIDMMGRKLATTRPDTGKKDTTKVTYTTLDGSKTIAGYKCKKVQAVSDKDTLIIYVTDDINVPNINERLIMGSSGFPDLTGLVMEFSIPAKDDMSVKYKVEKVEPKKTKKKDFRIPNDYTVKPPKEFAKSLGMGG
jgi:GLPGLI family protein